MACIYFVGRPFLFATLYFELGKVFVVSSYLSDQFRTLYRFITLLLLFSEQA